MAEDVERCVKGWVGDSFAATASISMSCSRLERVHPVGPAFLLEREVFPALQLSQPAEYIVVCHIAAALRVLVRSLDKKPALVALCRTCSGEWSIGDIAPESAALNGAAPLAPRRHGSEGAIRRNIR